MVHAITTVLQAIDLVLGILVGVKTLWGRQKRETPN